MSQSVRARIEVLEQKQRAKASSLIAWPSHKGLGLEGVYEPAWIREQYGISDPLSEAVDLKFGGLEWLPKMPV